MHTILMQQNWQNKGLQLPQYWAFLRSQGQFIGKTRRTGWRGQALMASSAAYRYNVGPKLRPPVSNPRRPTSLLQTAPRLMPADCARKFPEDTRRPKPAPFSCLSWPTRCNLGSSRGFRVHLILAHHARRRRSPRLAIRTFACRCVPHAKVRPATRYK